MIRWGIIGAGHMAKVFAQSIKDVDNAKLIAIASKDKNNLQTVGNDFKIDQKLRFNSYDDICKSKDVDAIYISTLNDTHFNLIKLSAQNNKHILCEKPFCLNLIEALEIQKILEKNSVKFFEAIAYLSHNQTDQIFRIIKSDEIGEVESIESSFGFKVRKIKNDSRLFNKNSGGGAILDLGCYPISFFNLFANENNKIDFISAEGTNCSTGVDYDAKIKLRIGSNIEAIGSVSFKENLSNDCKIYGEKGKITIPSPWLPPKKSYIEVENSSSYYKKFTSSEKTIYATQIDNISNLFIQKSPDKKNNVNIDESIEIMKILDNWMNNLL